MNNPANQFVGVFTGSAAGLTNVNASSLGGLSSSNFWRTGGNAGTSPGFQFLGTLDNQPLELRVNGMRVLRLEPNSNSAPNIVAGSPVNEVSSGVIGATIAGGGVADDSAGIIFSNKISSSYSAIGGGAINFIASNCIATTVSGGAQNVVLNDSGYSAVGGGELNTIGPSSPTGFIGAGSANTIQFRAKVAVIAGGEYNTIQTNADHAVIGGGSSNTNSSSFGTIGGGSSQNIQTNSGSSTIAGGEQNLIETVAKWSSIGGGYQNMIQSNAALSTIAGGFAQMIQTNASGSTIGGGSGNQIQAGSDTGVIAGGAYNTIQPNARIATISGGDENIIESNSLQGTIAGGGGNIIEGTASSASIGGGEFNTNSGQFATVPGGRDNHAAGDYSFAAGRRAKARHPGTFVWADSPSLSGQDFGSSSSNQFLIRASRGVGIGTTNPLTRLTVSGAGAFNAIGAAGIILDNTTPTNGHRWEWHALDDGRMELLDFTVGSSGTRLLIDTNGNVGIGTSSPTNKLHVAGGVSAMVFVTTSDRNAKTNCIAVDSRAVLQKVLGLPIAQWNFNEYPGIPHIGPMAQDFYAAFGLGGTDSGIATVDADGVALAAIKGLNEKLEEQAEAIRARDEHIAQLESRLSRLEHSFQAEALASKVETSSSCFQRTQ
jgi:hypothetical protein